MDRRNFIKTASIVGGGIFPAAMLTRAQALEESSNAFSDAANYDVIISGGSIAACLLAVKLSEKNLKVLVAERRHCLGAEIAATRKTWVKANEELNPSLANLLAPEAENAESLNLPEGGGATTPIDGEIQFYCGSVKKGLMRTLCKNSVDVLLCADIFAILKDADAMFCGAAFAMPHGTFFAKGRYFADASLYGQTSRAIFGLDSRISKASFTAEFEKARPMENMRSVKCPAELGFENNCATLRRSKKDPGRLFLEFGFDAQEQSDITQVEILARKKLALFGRKCRAGEIDIPEIAKANIPFFAQECSLEYAVRASKFSAPENTAALWAFPPKSAAELNKIPEAQSVAADEIAAWIKNSAAKIKDAETLVFSDGETSAKNLLGEKLVEAGRQMPFDKFNVENLPVKETSGPDVFVAGAGSAGVFAAQEAASEGLDVEAAEFFNDTGGTRTMGGVRGYYRGQSKHPYVARHDSKIFALGKKNLFYRVSARSIYNLEILEKSGAKLLTGALVCGAKTKGGKIESVIVCQRGRLLKRSPKISIDATADANLASLAKVPAAKGAGESQITQNFSHWDFPTKDAQGKYENINKDYDIIDVNLVSEFQRALMLSHAEARFYDFYPFIGVREARRPVGQYTLSLKDCILQKRFPDTVSTALSDFDPHYFEHTLQTRLGLLPPHFDPKHKVYIPYRCLVPEGLDNLLFCGRGISETHAALQFTRMSADVFLLGAATGITAAQIVKSGSNAHSFDFARAGKILLKRGFFGEDFLDVATANISELAKSAADGNDFDMLKISLLDKSEALPFMRKIFEDSKGVNLPAAQMLCAWGNKTAAKRVSAELEELLEKEIATPHKPDYYEKYDQSSTYWKINRNIAALAAGGHSECKDSVLKCFRALKSVGKKVPNPENRYYANRLDLCLTPYHNRIINLCLFVQTNPNKIFTPELERLAADAQIKNSAAGKSRVLKTRWRTYQAILELETASALARCGAQSGMDILREYLQDVHSNFRIFAETELAETSAGRLSAKAAPSFQA